MFPAVLWAAALHRNASLLSPGFHALARGGEPPADVLLPECVRREARSQHKEDKMVLAPLRCMLGGQPGTFVELGAFTGVELSNTVMLERCYGWTGLLVEGSPSNYAKLKFSGRKAPMLHSAVCADGDEPFVDFADSTNFHPDTSGEISYRSLTSKKDKRRATIGPALGVTRVACKSLAKILDEAGHPTIDVLFLDVEGAEAKVLSTVDPKRFSVVVMEAAHYPYDGGRHENNVEPILLRAGFRRERLLENRFNGAWNPVYVRADGPMTKECITCASEANCRSKYLVS